MNLVPKRQPLDKPKQRWDHLLARAAIKAARDDDTKFHFFAHLYKVIFP